MSSHQRAAGTPTWATVPGLAWATPWRTPAGDHHARSGTGRGEGDVAVEGGGDAEGVPRAVGPDRDVAGDDTEVGGHGRERQRHPHLAGAGGRARRRAPRPAARSWPTPRRTRGPATCITDTRVGWAPRARRAQDLAPHGEVGVGQRHVVPGSTTRTANPATAASKAARGPRRFGDGRVRLVAEGDQSVLIGRSTG